MNFIYKTIPRHTEEKIPLDQKIDIYFMIDMDKPSIREEHIILFNLTEQLVEPVQFDYNRRILSITPLSNLLPNNHYQLQIVGGEKGVKDIVGRKMPQTYEVEFTTKDVEGIKPPRILTPTDLSSVREAVQIELEPNLDVDYYELQISKSNTFHNLVWPTNEEKVYRTSEIRVIPDIAYQTGQYYMRVRSVGFDGLKSSWSPTIRYYYDGVPIIKEPEEEPMPDEIPPTEEAEEVAIAQKRKVVLQTSSHIQEQPTQLQKLQDIFSSKSSTSLTGLYVTSTTPKDNSVNNPLSNIQTLVIEFTDDIDPASITSDTCYVLIERN